MINLELWYSNCHPFPPPYPLPSRKGRQVGPNFTPTGNTLQPKFARDLRGPLAEFKYRLI